MDPVPDNNELLSALAAATAARPYARKLLVCRRAGVGRELLRALAARRTAWIGWEITTPARLAHELAAPLLARDGLVVADEFDELALVDAALDAVLAGSTEGLGRLADRVGLRQAVAMSVRTLRHAGVSAQVLAEVRLRDPIKGAQLAAILEGYEQGLQRSGRADGAAVLARALDAVHAGAGEGMCLMPDLHWRGLGGALLATLVDAGAAVLDDDPVHGLEPVPGRRGEAGARTPRSPLSWLHDVGGAPAETAAGVSVEVFAATTAAAELREVLRRVAAAGLSWDEVEIVATDAVEYGVALDGIARGLGIPVSFGAGLPLVRTRTGRAVQGLLAWIESGFDVASLRMLLERGDIASPLADVTGMALARRLRALRVGRGRERYADAIARRMRVLDARANDAGESDAATIADERVQLGALRDLVSALLDAVPDVRGAVAPGAAAAAVLACLRHVPVASAAEAVARERVTAQLERLRDTAQRAVTPDAALAVVRRILDQRVPPPGAQGTIPWRATGAHIHLSDLEHGGHTGRRATFVVGLDAGRFPGTGGTDPLLVDDDRARVNDAVPGARLSSSAERLLETRHGLAQLLARLRGRVTLSYPTWDAVDGRTSAPAAEVLQAFRLVSGDAAADYGRLRDAMKPVAGAVPHGTLLDGDDVWLAALAGGDVPRRGVTLVCDVYADLGRGARAVMARMPSRSVPGPVHGAITPRASHDPRRSLAVVSATQLQTLGTCPHRYLLRHVLGLRPPQDPPTSPERWLSPLERGALLHAVYEHALAAAARGDVDVTDAAFEARALALLEEQTSLMRSAVVPPGERIYALECAALAADVRAFVAMARADGARIVALEHRFGRDGADAVDVALPDGSTIRVGGAIDRVDAVEGGLSVIDYKTGSASRFGGKHGVFDGGRRLQHALYAAVAERLFGQPVVRAEYLFPTERSANQRVAFSAAELRDGAGIITELLDLAAGGWFVPTTDPDDCRVCDYRAVCRVRDLEYGKIESPMAAWAREAEGAGPEALRRLRR